MSIARQPEEKKYHPEEKISREHQTYESKVIGDFAENTQNTHKKTISTGVGMVLLRLSKKYVGENLSDEIIEKAWRGCVSELEKISANDETFKAAIEFIIEKANEPNDYHDHVSLHLPALTDSKGEQRILFPLKIVLILVLKALTDDKEFAQNYIGSESEKLQQAQSDQPIRLNNFLNSLNSTRQGTCHHGVRNELVFLLNHTYNGIHLIEDERSTVLSFFKNRIHGMYLSCYQNANYNEREKLDQALIKWMDDSNATQLLTLVDPEKILCKELENLFVENGINPNEVDNSKKTALENLIEEALQNLEFSCDPKRYPIMDMTGKIFQFFEGEAESDLSHALIYIKSYIQKNCQWDNPDYQRKIGDFYHLYTVHKLLRDNDLLLRATGKMTDELEGLARICASYFQSMRNGSSISPVDDEVIEKIHLTRGVIETLKKDNACHVIENFFKEWFYAKDANNTHEIRRLYSLLLNEDMCSKITLSDEMIGKLFSPNAETGEIELTPYLINKVFLCAILNTPAKWSSRFKDIFCQVENFVKNKFNQDSKRTSADLFSNSYPPPLLEQLEYLRELSIWSSATVSAEEVLPPAPKRPENLILIPEHVQTLDEWLLVASNLGKEKILHYSSLYESKIQKLISESSEEELSRLIKNHGHRLDLVLSYFSASSRESFLKMLSPDGMGTCLREGVLCKAVAEVTKGTYSIEILKCLIPIDFTPEEKYAYANFGNYGPAPLLLAVKSDSEHSHEIIAWLAAQEADFDVSGKGGDTAAHIAASKGNIEALKLLKKLGASFDRWNDDQLNVVEIAAKNGQLQILKYLHEELKFSSEDYQGIIRQTVFNGHIQVFKYLQEELGIDMKFGAESHVSLTVECAIREERIDVLKNLKELNVFVSENYQTIACLAAAGGCIRVLKYLQEELQFSSTDYQSIARLAAANGHVQVLQYLKELGIQVDYENLAYLAAEFVIKNKRPVEALKFLKEEFKLSSENYQSIASLAAADGKIQMLQYLREELGVQMDYGNFANQALEKYLQQELGIDIDHENPAFLAAKFAIQNKRLDVLENLQELKKLGVNFSSPSGAPNKLNIGDEHSWYGTTTYEHISEIQLNLLTGVIELGIFHPDSELNGRTAVHWAITQYEPSICKRSVSEFSDLLLTLKKMHANFNLPDKSGFSLSPIHTALIAQGDDDTLLSMLLNLGVDPNLPLSEGTRVSNPHYAPTKLLMLEMKPGMTAVHIAVLAELPSCLSKLKEAYANFNLYDDDGDAPIHVAAKMGNIELLQKLIQLGADPNLPTKVKGSNNGQTLMDIAVQMKDREMVENLKELLATPQAKPAYAGSEIKNSPAPEEVTLHIGNLLHTEQPFAPKVNVESLAKHSFLATSHSSETATSDTRSPQGGELK